MQTEEEKVREDKHHHIHQTRIPQGMQAIAQKEEKKRKKPPSKKGVY